MAEECIESSVATSSTPPNWWDITHHHASAVFYNSANWVVHDQNPNSNNSSCDDDVSISTSSYTTNASNHSALPHHASDNQLWTHVLLNIGNGVELQNNEQDMSTTTGMFEHTACSDYLKKLDTNNNGNNWENFQSFNNNNNNNGVITTHSHNILDNERLLKLSNLVNTWSIALPRTEAGLCHLIDDEHEHHLRAPTVPTHGGFEPPDHGDLDLPASGLFRRSSFHNNNNNQIGVKQFYDNASTRNFGDYISFNGPLPKPPLVAIHASNNPSFNLPPDTKKHIHPISSPTRISGRGSGVSSEGKKKRSEESSETSIKKTKQDNSTTASNKMHQPKVKIGDRITALQQIVSPFGKTDTASVLTETIGYIKFLQEQVQLLSSPYMKTNSNKDPWQSLERKEAKVDGKIDLRSRGLCLVPISCTPQVYRENTGSDYWTPYRGCFYR